jgi:hypothetical protein
MNGHMFHRRRLFVLVMLAALLLPTPAVFAGNDNPGVAPPHANAFGKSYAEWAVAWWQWALSQPGANHPLLDETGANCAVGQQGKVWNLVGVFFTSDTAERTCTIPTGTALLIPILNAWADNVGEPNPFTPEQQLARCSGFVENPADLFVSVDGHPLQNLEGYAVEPTLFDYTMPDHGLFDAAFGFNFSGHVEDAASCGYYVLLNPLSKGAHDIQIKATNTSGFSLDVIYHLTVAAAGHLKAQGAQSEQFSATAVASGSGKERAAHKHKNRHGGQHRSKGKHRH